MLCKIRFGENNKKHTHTQEWRRKKTDIIHTTNRGMSQNLTTRRKEEKLSDNWNELLHSIFLTKVISPHLEVLIVRDRVEVKGLAAEVISFAKHRVE